MNEIKRPPLHLLGLLVAACLASCSPGAGEAPPLEGAAIGGAFALTDQNGRQVRDTDFAGQYRLIYFGFTSCPDVCPVDMQMIGQALRQLEKSEPETAAKLQPIFISVDPQRDTPPVVKQYVSAFHPRIVGLTGTPQQIADVTKRYGVYSQKQEVEGSSEYMVDHSRIMLLFGPEGQPISIIPHDKGAGAIADELRKWVK